jgi:hypothetical protein
VNLSSIKVRYLAFAASHNSTEPFGPFSQDDCGLFVAPFCRPPKCAVSEAENFSVTDVYVRRVNIAANEVQTKRARRTLPEA